VYRGINMETYDFYYGTQAAEFERPEIPEIVAKKGIKANIAGSKTEVVILNVHD